ncbi:MAG: DUF721 domain-containing protein [Deltaproteobacteria bacterium]|nr:DUF721 domain-containing protein [Deltaproteobacteria bacterium]
MARQNENSSWNATSDILGGLIPNLTNSARWREYQVWRVWEEVVGGTLARKARPNKIQNGKLFVTVASSVFMQELQFVKWRLRERLNQTLGEGTVKEIMFVIGPVQAVALRSEVPRHLPLPPFTPLHVPALRNAELEAALNRVLEARRRRLTQKGPSRG